MGGRPGFLDERRLLRGPWQAFERDVARLMLANGFEDVRVVGGTGDRGGDILGVQAGELWVIQCKFTSNSPPPRDAIEEVVHAAEFYGAARLMVATSRPPGDSFLEERARFQRLGLEVILAPPALLLEQMARTPDYAPSRRALRVYQEDAAARMRRALTDTSRAQVVLATGLGKTVVMADVVADLLADGLVEGGRVLVLAHTRDLVDQLQRAFWHQLPSWVPTHQMVGGETPSFWDGVTFASVQSVSAGLEALPHFGLVLIDEAHHVGAETFQRVLRDLAPPMLGGVTATPWRGDAYDIDQVFGPPLVRLGIADGLAQGFLADVDYRLLADNVDWAFVQERSSYRYSLTQLNRQLILPTRDEEAVRTVRRVFDEERRRAGIVFSPTVAHAASFAAQLRAYGFRAEAIAADIPGRERDRLMSRFRAGGLDIVCTVDLFNEGVDVPDVDLIVFMRATHSRRIFVQQLGRGLRPSPTKDKVVVLDFVTDLRRMAEVVELDRAVRAGTIERLSLGGRLVEFTDRSAGSFMRDWLLDQASLVLRDGDPTLDLPHFDYPSSATPGSVQ